MHTHPNLASTIKHYLMRTKSNTICQFIALQKQEAFKQLANNSFCSAKKYSVTDLEWKLRNQ